MQGCVEVIFWECRDKAHASLRLVDFEDPENNDHYISFYKPSLNPNPQHTIRNTGKGVFKKYSYDTSHYTERCRKRIESLDLEAIKQAINEKLHSEERGYSSYSYMSSSILALDEAYNCCSIVADVLAAGGFSNLTMREMGIRSMLSCATTCAITYLMVACLQESLMPFESFGSFLDTMRYPLAAVLPPSLAARTLTCMNGLRESDYYWLRILFFFAIYYLFLPEISIPEFATSCLIKGVCAVVSYFLPRMLSGQGPSRISACGIGAMLGFGIEALVKYLKWTPDLGSLGFLENVDVIARGAVSIYAILSPLLEEFLADCLNRCFGTGGVTTVFQTPEDLKNTVEAYLLNQQERQNSTTYFGSLFSFFSSSATRLRGAVENASLPRSHPLPSMRL